MPPPLIAPFAHWTWYDLCILVLIELVFLTGTSTSPYAPKPRSDPETYPDIRVHGGWIISCIDACRTQHLCLLSRQKVSVPPILYATIAPAEHSISVRIRSTFSQLHLLT
jgi:hypothetical protein